MSPLRWMLPGQIRELVPESQAYMDLLAFERKLDQTIMRKRVDIQEALKRPMKVATGAAWGPNARPPVFASANSCGFSPPSCQQQKRKLRLYISNTFNPARPDADDSDGSIASWELRVEGKLLDDVSSHGQWKGRHSRGSQGLQSGPDHHFSWTFSPPCGGGGGVVVGREHGGSRTTWKVHTPQIFLARLTGRGL